MCERGAAFGDVRRRARPEQEPRDEAVYLRFPNKDHVVDTTRHVSPATWRRALQLVVDGLATRRGPPSPLPAPALENEPLDAALAAWRP